jgi:hypothetical protein
MGADGQSVIMASPAHMMQMGVGQPVSAIATALPSGQQGQQNSNYAPYLYQLIAQQQQQQRMLQGQNLGQPNNPQAAPQSQQQQQQAQQYNQQLMQQYGQYGQQFAAAIQNSPNYLAAYAMTYGQQAALAAAQAAGAAGNNISNDQQLLDGNENQVPMLPSIGNDQGGQPETKSGDNSPEHDHDEDEHDEHDHDGEEKKKGKKGKTKKEDN